MSSLIEYMMFILYIMVPISVIMQDKAGYAYSVFTFLSSSWLAT